MEGSFLFEHRYTSVLYELMSAWRQLSRPKAEFNVAEQVKSTVKAEVINWVDMPDQ